jgi:protein SCO1/2
MRPGRLIGRFAALVAVVMLAWNTGAAAQEALSKQAAEPAALPIDLGGPFALVDHNGRAVTDEDFRGSFLLVFFGYANCPGICPIGLRTMTAALDLLGAEGRRVAPLLITVDPERDTPANLAPALAKIHPRLIGLTGTAAQLAAARRAYKVGVKPAGRAWQGGALFDHGSFVYLMGPDGKFLTLFPPVMDPQAMAAAIGRYMS